jgi:hypothetical protein
MKKKKKNILVDQIKLRGAEDKMANKKEPKVRWVKAGVGDKVFLAIGWVVMTPFILQEIIIRGYQWAKRKVKGK